MTTNQTIDGVLVSRELLERIREKLSQTDYTWSVNDPEEELRALLDAPKCSACNDTGRMHEPGCEPGACTACFDKTATKPQPDPVLCEFYDVTDYPGLVHELVGHIAQLQDSAKRNVKPWEDTFPPTLLPAYIERVNAENAAAQPQFGPSHWADPEGNTITAELNAYNLKFGGAPAAATAHYTKPLYAEQPAPVAVVLPVDPERERLMEIVQQYPNVDPLEYDAAVRTLRK